MESPSPQKRDRPNVLFQFAKFSLRFASDEGINLDLSEVFLFVSFGAILGLAGGLFAIGGAMIAIPLLTAVFGFTQHASQGTAMLMALASASMTLAIYARKKLLQVRDGLVMTGCSTALGLASSQAVRYISDTILQRSFGTFLIALAVFVWFGHLGERDRPVPLSTPVQIGIGALAGALSGLFVVGGALVTVPLLERVAGYSQQRAQAMALLMLVPASAIGLAVYSSARYVQWGDGFALAVGAVALAPLGSRTALAMRPRLLRRCFAVVQAGAGIMLIVSH
jgi:uncharacterized membrane protein YfcA